MCSDQRLASLFSLVGLFLIGMTLVLILLYINKCNYKRRFSIPIRVNQFRPLKRKVKHGKMQYCHKRVCKADQVLSLGKMDLDCIY